MGIDAAWSKPETEREYNKLKRSFKKEHRYPGREEEVAARVVNKQRSEYGETKTQKQKDREGKSPDRDLPIKDYQHLTARQVENKIGKLSRKDVQQVKKYEQQHKNRKTVLQVLAKKLKAA